MYSSSTRPVSDKSTTFSSVSTYHNSSTVNLGITKTMFKLRKHGLRFRHRLFKRKKKNINNGSGDHNNNSNEGEKTKEMVLGLPTNRVKSTTFSSVTTYHNSSTANLGITKNMVKRGQLGLRHPPSKKKKKNINNGHGDNNNNSNEGEKTKEMVRFHPPKRGQVKVKLFEELFGRTHNLKVQLKGGDGSGGDKDKKGGSGSGDNDGGDKTEGGGGVGGKMGTKTESKGQHDNRNGFSYHAGRADPDISGAKAILLLSGLVVKNN